MTNPRLNDSKVANDLVKGSTSTPKATNAKETTQRASEHHPAVQKRCRGIKDILKANGLGARSQTIYTNIYLKAVEGKSKKAAIKSQCLECVNQEREEVRKCTDIGCPLYNHRPYR